VLIDKSRWPSGLVRNRAMCDYAPGYFINVSNLRRICGLLVKIDC
jgi:hypothetical protein